MEEIEKNKREFNLIGFISQGEDKTFTIKLCTDITGVSAITCSIEQTPLAPPPPWVPPIFLVKSLGSGIALIDALFGVITLSISAVDSLTLLTGQTQRIEIKYVIGGLTTIVQKYLDIRRPLVN